MVPSTFRENTDTCRNTVKTWVFHIYYVTSRNTTSWCRETLMWDIFHHRFSISDTHCRRNMTISQTFCSIRSFRRRCHFADYHVAGCEWNIFLKTSISFSRWRWRRLFSKIIVWCGGSHFITPYYFIDDADISWQHYFRWLLPPDDYAVEATLMEARCDVSIVDIFSWWWHETLRHYVSYHFRFSSPIHY